MTMTSTTEQPRAIATARTPGIDVARALAILGMILVNYISYLGASEKGPGWLIWLHERFEGRSAALFVLLAGIGVALRSRCAREDPRAHGRFERRALLKRAGVLFLVGLLNLHMLEWDILHFYGVYLAIAALLLTVRSSVLWMSALTLVAGAVGLQLGLDYEVDLALWSPRGAVADIFFNGLHPVFPWMAFLLVGMWIGRLDFRRATTRNRLLVAGLAALIAGEGLGAVFSWMASGDADPGALAALLTNWPRPPTPTYVLTAGGTAVAVVCLCVAVTERRPGARWVLALTATGQLAFTLYIGHAVALVIPRQHGLLEAPTLVGALAYGLAFYLVGVGFSWWWRRRWPQGPLETLIRQLTGRTAPAPWGGALISRAPKG